MATAAPNQTLPLFYSGLEPLNVSQHGKMKIRAIEKAPIIAATHAIPATVDEFALLQRHYPIVFSVGENPVPLALMSVVSNRRSRGGRVLRSGYPTAVTGAVAA